MENKKRLHFGVLFGTMDDTCQYEIWTGIVDYARKHDICLMAYLGAYQTVDDDIALHYETCVESIQSSDYLDGVIVFSGFIANLTNNEYLEKKVALISERLPLVSVSYVTPGVTSVLIDNISGIRGAAEHLIKTHGKKSIAFVKGPDGHPEAEDRFEGYKRALADNGVPYDERLVFPGNFSQKGGRLAVDKLLSMPDVSADAIIACDDLTAIGVLGQLQAHDLFAPADIAVVGFDDDRDSANFIPSISTVRQDFFKIGQICAESLASKIDGKPIEEIIYVRPSFVARQSCGCLEKGFSGTLPECGDSGAKADSLYSYVSHRLLPLFREYVPEPQITKWAATLIEAVKENPFSKDRFLSLLVEILVSYQQYSNDILVWNEAFGILTTGVQLHSDEVECLYSILSTFILAVALVHETRIKEGNLREIVISDNRLKLRRIAGNLVLKFNIDSFAEELQGLLPELSIDNVIIGLYRYPIKGGSGADRAIATLIGFNGNKIVNLENEASNPILLSDYSTIEKYSSAGGHGELFFLPLFVKDEELGIMLVPYDAGVPVDTYETLRVNISTAVKGAGLIKEIEYQSSQATKANRAKSDFLSSMSHEMRTPMNAIIGMTAIGSKAKSLNEKDYALNRIGDASSHLLGVINDILDMTKIEANKLELAHVEFDFEQMIQKVLAIVSFRIEEKKHRLAVNIDGNIPQFIVGDDQRLSQVVTNLMSNAVKFTPDGGNVDLNISVIDESGEDCEFQVEVADSGIGVPPEQQGRIFNAFEQAESGTNREYGGTGLGLTISRRIIELMGGRIWVESEPGKGAKFIFTFKAKRVAKTGDGPDSSSGALQNGGPAASEKNEFEGKTLLIAEDIEINREILISILDGTGLLIECAENGLEALEMVKASPGKYDMVFMDAQMPKMDGYEATRAIRALPEMKGVRLPIVAMTANVFKSDIANSLAAGMDEHIGKPLDVDKVFTVLRMYLT